MTTRSTAETPPDADLDLLDRVRGGDRGAFEALVKRHGGALQRLATGLLKDRARAEEVVQEAWIAVLEGLDAFERRASFRTWVFQIVANKARTRAARDGRTIPFSAFGGDGEGDRPAVDADRFDRAGMWKESPGPWSGENPERLARGVETRAAIERAIAALPEGQRAVITLRDLDGLDADEACEVLGITAGNQRVLLHRARAAVRRALEDPSGGPESAAS